MPHITQQEKLELLEAEVLACHKYKKEGICIEFKGNTRSDNCRGDGTGEDMVGCIVEMHRLNITYLVPVENRSK